MAKVLVIDHEKMLRVVFTRILAVSGHEVHMAATGLMGLELFDKVRPDVTVLDHNIPGTRGSKVMEALARRDPGARVVVLTGFADPDGERKRGHPGL